MQNKQILLYEKATLNLRQHNSSVYSKLVIIQYNVKNNNNTDKLEKKMQHGDQ